MTDERGSPSSMTPRAGDATQVAKDGQLGSPSDSQPLQMPTPSEPLSSGARSPESYEREIRSLETRLSEECANSYRLAQELSEAKADGEFVGIVDEYGSVWSGEPGASELIGDLMIRADGETSELHLRKRGV